MNLNGTSTNPGELRVPITLQKRTVVTNAGGFSTPVWSNIAVVMAKWTNVHGGEVWAAQMARAVQPATVLIRWRSDIDTTCAILKGSQLYEIVSMDNVQERNEYLELKVSRMAGG